MSCGLQQSLYAILALILFVFQKLYNQELPLSSVGYSSVLKLLHDLPNGVCDVKQIGDDWIVFICTKG